MWIVGHAQVGWLLAHATGFEVRDRRIAAVAAVVPDIDGLTLLGGLDPYLNGHHVYLHNLAVAALIPLVAAVFARRRLATALISLVAVLLHFGSDGFGLLELHPLWPFSTTLWWPNSGNFGIAFLSEFVVPMLLLRLTAAVFRKHHISVLETLSPRFDRILVTWLGDFNRRHDAEIATHRATFGGTVTEIVADVILFAFLTGLAHIVVMIVGPPSWRHAIFFGALALLVVRWLVPFVTIAWLKRYAACFPPQ